jgi:hypothetical protein
MPFIESTSKSPGGLSLLYISFDKLLEFRIVLIKWLKTFFYKELFDNNIIFIKDILDEENKFKTYDELNNQFNQELSKELSNSFLTH